MTRIAVLSLLLLLAFLATRRREVPWYYRAAVEAARSDEDGWGIGV
jgi:hypothetical protein